MKQAGSALMGIGHGTGENRAVIAAQQAIESPLLEVSIDGARGVVFNITGGSDLSMHEVNEAAEVITAAVSPDANIIFGATIKPELQDRIEITVIATGFDASYFNKRNSSVVESAEEESSLSGDITDVDEDVETINMDEDKASEIAGDHIDEESTPFHKTEDVPSENIWASEDDDKKDESESDIPAFLRRFRRKKTDEKQVENESTEN